MGYQVYEDGRARDLGVIRWAGYGVPAICDHPGCGTRIDRGLAYRCGDGDEGGCGLSFCLYHLWSSVGSDPVQMCERCIGGGEPFTPKPDLPEWEAHMLLDPSWEAWRNEHPVETEQMRRRVGIPEALTPDAGMERQEQP